MMKRICDICGKVIIEERFGNFTKAVQEESHSRDTMIIKTRSKEGTCINYDDVCVECTDGILAYIASRKECRK
jgi:hypothetical protein